MKQRKLKKLSFKEWATSLRGKIGMLFGLSLVLLFLTFSGIMYYQISNTVVPMVSDLIKSRLVCKFLSYQ